MVKSKIFWLGKILFMVLILFIRIILNEINLVDKVKWYIKN